MPRGLDLSKGLGTHLLGIAAIHLSGRGGLVTAVNTWERLHVVLGGVILGNGALAHNVSTMLDLQGHTC